MDPKTVKIDGEQQDWLEDHPEVNFSAFVRGQLDKLMSAYEDVNVSEEEVHRIQSEEQDQSERTI